jgi:hypothetical protein
MKNLAWFKFYPADWRADQALRACSPAARGLWIECMCIMHEAEPYGHLLLNGRPPTETQLATMAAIPLDQIPSLLDELESAGVFSRTRTRVIYSRRMTRDAKKRVDGKNAAETGDKLPNSRRSQTIGNKEGNLPPPRVVEGVEIRPPPSLESQSLREKEETPTGVSKKARAAPRGERLPDDWKPDESLIAWARSEGYSDHAIALETEKFRDFWHAKPGAGGLKLDWGMTWRNWLRNSRQPTEKPAVQGQTSGQAELIGFASREAEWATWCSRAKAYRETGTWSQIQWGWPPGDPSCDMPRTIQAYALGQVDQAPPYPGRKAA